MQTCLCHTSEQLDGPVPSCHDDAIRRSHVDCGVLLLWISLCVVDVSTTFHLTSAHLLRMSRLSRKGAGSVTAVFLKKANVLIRGQQVFCRVIPFIIFRFVYTYTCMTVPLRGGCWTSGLVWMRVASIEHVSAYRVGFLSALTCL